MRAAAVFTVHPAGTGGYLQRYGRAADGYIGFAADAEGCFAAAAVGSAGVDGRRSSCTFFAGTQAAALFFTQPVKRKFSWPFIRSTLLQIAGLAFGKRCRHNKSGGDCDGYHG